jgi:Uma2 family endonuclease
MGAVVSPPERLVILRGISWETYCRIVAEHGEKAGTRFTFDKGLLEIMVLSHRHERTNRTLAALVEVLAEEAKLDLERSGSTTFRREDLEKGFEPDSCFYLEDAERIRGQDEINLAKDPPPDLIIEVDITHESLDRLPIFAAVGVPEVWRSDGVSVAIFRLEGGSYVSAPHSAAIAAVSSEALTRFLADSRTMTSTAWLRSVRDWVRSQRGRE